MSTHLGTLFGVTRHPTGLGEVEVPVELAELDLDLVEVGALQDVLGPAVLHQLAQLLHVAPHIG